MVIYFPLPGLCACTLRGSESQCLPTAMVTLWPARRPRCGMIYAPNSHLLASSLPLSGCQGLKVGPGQLWFSEDCPPPTNLS